MTVLDFVFLSSNLLWGSSFSVKFYASLNSLTIRRPYIRYVNNPYSHSYIQVLSNLNNLE